MTAGWDGGRRKLASDEWSLENAVVDKPPLLDVIRLKGVPVEEERVIAFTALAVLCAV